MKRHLPTVDPTLEGLGQPTIMNRALAARYGAAYVHLVSFAIDIDRIREEIDTDDQSSWPFGFEVFLLQMHLLGLLDMTDETHVELLEDTIQSVFEQHADEYVFGSQLPFAVYDAAQRGELPELLLSSFSHWKKRPEELCNSLDQLWLRPEVEAADLAMACLEVQLIPPIAPPSQVALEEMLTTWEINDTQASPSSASED